MAYAQARKDFEYLETIHELVDWVEIQGDTISLMREPTKAKGEEFYKSCIALWFQEHRLNDGYDLTRRARAIAYRYGEDC
jgi:hypothetical protein